MRTKEEIIQSIYNNCIDEIKMEIDLIEMINLFSENLCKGMKKIF